MLDDIQLESYVNPETISTPKTNKPFPSTSFEKVSPKDIMPEFAVVSAKLLPWKLFIEEFEVG
ncbi:hypothetical protein ACI65C_003965 [Semiaphis heraclei]